MAGSDRDNVATELRKQHESDASNRALAEAANRSYGGVHRFVAGAGVVFRSRGGEGRKESDAVR